MINRLSMWMRLCDHARLLNKDLTVTSLQALLFVANRTMQEIPTRLKDVQEELGCSSSSATRIIQSHLDEGTGLFTLKINPEKRNERIIELTPKGLRFVKGMLEITNAYYSERGFVPSND